MLLNGCSMEWFVCWWGNSCWTLHFLWRFLSQTKSDIPTLHIKLSNCSCCTILFSHCSSFDSDPWIGCYTVLAAHLCLLFWCRRSSDTWTLFRPQLDGLTARILKISGIRPTFCRCTPIWCKTSTNSFIRICHMLDFHTDWIVKGDRQKTTCPQCVQWMNDLCN